MTVLEKIVIGGVIAFLISISFLEVFGSFQDFVVLSAFFLVFLLLLKRFG
jgi:hypothetical protein